MDPALGVIIAGAAVAAAGVGGLLYYLQKKRTEAFHAWAASNGFVADASTGVPGEFESFRLFSQGKNRRVRNLLRGQKEVGQVVVCDYSFVTGSGKHRTTHSQTVCVVRTPGRGAETFFIRRQRGFFDAVGKLFGGQDVNFEDDPVFSKGWVLQGDEQRVRRFFTPRLRGWFNDNADKSVVVEGQADQLLVHFGRTLSPKELSDLVVTTTNLRRHWG